MKRTIVGLIALTLVGACSKESERNASSVSSPPNARVAQAPAPRVKPAIDPKGREAAELLVDGFVRLVNQGRFADAYMLLGPGAAPRSEFESHFAGLSELQVRARPAGDEEGAAGSIYLSIPLDISGRAGDRKIEHHATAVLRRVNDVPGSSEAQRRWHIERIDWKQD